MTQQDGDVVEADADLDADGSTGLQQRIVATPEAVYAAFTSRFKGLATPAGGVTISRWSDNLRAQLAEAISTDHRTADLRWWLWLFATASLSPFLMGFAEPSAKHPQRFRLSIGWMLNPRNLRRVRELQFNQQQLSPELAQWAVSAMEMAQSMQDALMATTEPEPVIQDGEEN